MALSLESPLWLAGLLIIPLVWWLHRFRELGRREVVAAAFLWRSSPPDAEVGRFATRPQPVWLLRALLLAMLVLALAAPHWQVKRPASLTVWLDDSASMFVEEEGGSTRMQLAVTALVRELSAYPYDSLILRSLGAPGRVVQLSSSDSLQRLRDFLREPRGEPTLPAPAAMAADRLHWLVSDGASRGLVAWAARAPLSRIIQVGRHTENVALTRLALRRQSDAMPQLSVELYNGGLGAAARRVEVRAGNRLLADYRLELDSGEREVRLVDVPEISASPLTAQIWPADALSRDDRLDLSSNAWGLTALRLSGDCGPWLKAALAAHPDLVSEDSTAASARLNVYCGDFPDRPAVPALLLAGGEGLGAIMGTPSWTRDAGRLGELGLAPAWLALPAASGLPAISPGRVLLQAGGQVLVSHDPQRQTLSIAFDLAWPALVRQPEYPLLLAALVDRLLGREGSHRGMGSVAAAADVSVAPRQLRAVAERSALPEFMARVDLSAYLLASALVLLLADILLVWRRCKPAAVVGAGGVL